VKNAKGNKMKKWLISIVFVLSTSGCQMVLEHTERDLADVALTRQIAKNSLVAAPIKIGVIKGAMGQRIEELPTQTTEAMDEYLIMADRDPNTLTDYELGYSLGLCVRIKEQIVKMVLERYAPEVLRYWP
jgi:hypothetical protein